MSENTIARLIATRVRGGGAEADSARLLRELLATTHTAATLAVALTYYGFARTDAAAQRAAAVIR